MLCRALCSKFFEQHLYPFWVTDFWKHFLLVDFFWKKVLLHSKLSRSSAFMIRPRNCRRVQRFPARRRLVRGDLSISEYWSTRWRLCASSRRGFLLRSNPSFSILTCAWISRFSEQLLILVWWFRSHGGYAGPSHAAWCRQGLSPTTVLLSPFMWCARRSVARPLLMMGAWRLRLQVEDTIWSKTMEPFSDYSSVLFLETSTRFLHGRSFLDSSFNATA